MGATRGDRTLDGSTSGIRIDAVASIALAATLVHEALSGQLRVVITVDAISRASALTRQPLGTTHEGGLRK